VKTNDILRPNPKLTRTNTNGLLEMLGIQSQRLHDLAIRAMDCNAPAEIADHRRREASEVVTARRPSLRRNASI